MLFYRDKDGVPRDAELHEPVLAAGDSAAARAISEKIMREIGLTDEEIASLKSTKEDAVKHLEKRGVRYSVLKLNEEQRIVYGWASIVKENGEVVEDHQGDMIEPDTIEKAATEFMKELRTHGQMHQKAWVIDGDELISKVAEVGKVIHSLPLTKEIGDALKIYSPYEGWVVGVYVADDAMWKGYKDGVYKGFSIGGRGAFEERS